MPTADENNSSVGLQLLKLAETERDEAKAEAERLRQALIELQNSKKSEPVSESVSVSEPVEEHKPEELLPGPDTREVFFKTNVAVVVRGQRYDVAAGQSLHLPRRDLSESLSGLKHKVHYE